MRIQDCFPGLQVVHKTTGKPATIDSIFINDSRVHILFENGSSANAHPRDLDLPSEESTPSTDFQIPLRPCPECGQKMHSSALTCPHCGYAYRTQKKGSGFGKILVFLILCAAIGYAIWKFVLHERLP